MKPHSVAVSLSILIPVYDNDLKHKKAGVAPTCPNCRHQPPIKLRFVTGKFADSSVCLFGTYS